MDFDDVDSLVLYNTTRKLIANINLGMQACGDAMIGQHGCIGDQCIKLSRLFVGQRRFSLLLCFHHHLKIIS